MPRLFAFVLSFTLCGLSFLLPSPARAARCDAPQTNAEIAACLEEELRDSDVKINQSYQALMRQLDDARKTALRTEQRGWLKKRDAACQLDTKEPSRERWMQAILKDHIKTVCVVRFTRTRVGELDRMLTARAAPAPGAPAAPGPTPGPAPMSPPLDDNDLYELATSVRHVQGKWYYEVQLNVGEIARTAETTLAMGFVGQSMVGKLINVRRRDRDLPTLRMGLALDLDDGKLYVHADGAWLGGTPGSAQAVDVKLGRQYEARVISSVALNELIQKQLVQVNFGDRPFAYAMPPGYRPFSER